MVSADEHDLRPADRPGVMMYPVLAEVRYDETHRVAGDRRLMGASLVLNWIAGSAFPPRPPSAPCHPS